MSPLAVPPMQIGIRASGGHPYHLRPGKTTGTASAKATAVSFSTADPPPAAIESEWAAIKKLRLKLSRLPCHLGRISC